MKKIVFILLAIAFHFSCNTSDQKEIIASKDTSVEIPVIPLKDFHTSAGNYVDQVVATEGIVDHVCRHGGKRLFLVSDDADLHIDGEKRFDEDLSGSAIKVTGIIREFRVDETYCLKQEDDNIKSHSNGLTDDEMFELEKATIREYRDSMQMAGVDHLSFYSLDYISHVEKK